MFVIGVDYVCQISTSKDKTREPDPTHLELKHKTTRKTPTHEHTPDRPHAHPPCFAYRSRTKQIFVTEAENLFVTRHGGRKSVPGASRSAKIFLARAQTTRNVASRPAFVRGLRICSCELSIRQIRIKSEWDAYRSHQDTVRTKSRPVTLSPGNCGYPGGLHAVATRTWVMALGHEGRTIHEA